MRFASRCRKNIIRKTSTEFSRIGALLPSNLPRINSTTSRRIPVLNEQTHHQHTWTNQHRYALLLSTLPQGEEVTEGEVDQLIITPSVDRQPKDGKNLPREELGVVGWFLHDVGGFIGEFNPPICPCRRIPLFTVACYLMGSFHSPLDKTRRDGKEMTRSTRS